MLNFSSNRDHLEAAGIVGSLLFGKSTVVGWLLVGGVQLRQRRECRGISAAASGVAPLSSLTARRNRRAFERPCQGGEVGQRIRVSMPGLPWTSCSSVSKHCFTVTGLRIYL